MRILLFGSLLLSGCVHVAAPRAPLVVVAAGDVSHPEVRDQAVTATLVESLNPAAVLVAGDAQYGDGLLEEFQRAYEPTWGRFKSKTWPAPGNHEYKSGAHGYFAYFGAQAGPAGRGYYSFDLGDWHFLSLNTGHACVDGACAPGSPQVEWLEADLAATKKKCVVAYFHHPPFGSGEKGSFEPARALWKVLAAHRVELVITGHEHFYERFPPLDGEGRPAEDGMVEVVVGTGGIGFSNYGAIHPLSLLRQNDTLGVLKLSLSEGGYVADFVPVPGGAFRDHFEGRCR